MNEHVQLNMGIIFRSVQMLCTEIEQTASMPLEDSNHQRWCVNTVYNPTTCSYNGLPGLADVGMV